MNKLITLLHMQKCLNSIKALIGQILSTTVDALTELENKITPDTWKENTIDSEGYVTKGEGNPNKVWGTDAEGNPMWRDETAVSLSVTGVKGNTEVEYRNGNVNITPENIGALPLTGGTATGSLSVETAAEEAQLNVKRGNRAGRLVVSSANNFGLYDDTNKKWMFKSTPEGNVTVYGSDENGYKLTDKLNLVASKSTSQGTKASVTFSAELSRMYLVTFKSTGSYNEYFIMYAAIVNIIGSSSKTLHVKELVNSVSNFSVNISNSGQEVSISSNSYGSSYESINVWAV